MRFGIGLMAPFGRSLSLRYMFSGDVNMWRSIVTGRIARKTMNDTTWSDPPDLVAAGEVARCRRSAWRSGSATNDHFSNAGRPSSAMRQASAPKPVTASARSMPRPSACSGFDLMRMRYGRRT